MRCIIITGPCKRRDEIKRYVVWQDSHINSHQIREPVFPSSSSSSLNCVIYALSVTQWFSRSICGPICNSRPIRTTHGTYVRSRTSSSKLWARSQPLRLVGSLDYPYPTIIIRLQPCHLITILVVSNSVERVLVRPSRDNQLIA